jgi:Protein of unknown function (DUF2523)
MGGFFTTLMAFIGDGLAWIGKLFVAVFTAGYDLLRDIPSWVFDQALSVATTALGAVEAPTLTGLAALATPLPAALLNILAVLGVAQAISIIIAAITIRVALQLIPFVRLGS